MSKKSLKDKIIDEIKKEFNDTIPKEDREYISNVYKEYANRFKKEYTDRIPKDYRERVGKLKKEYIDKLQKELIGIEKRTDISDDKKVSRIIKITASTCAGVAVQPIPFADIFILTPIQAIMGMKIAAIRKVSISNNDALTTIKEISGVVGLGFLAQQTAIGAYKTVIPFWGAVTTIPIVFGLTYGIGRVMDAYVINKERGQLLSPDAMKEIWEQAMKEGKSFSNEKPIQNSVAKISNKDKIVRFINTNLDEAIIIASVESLRNGVIRDETDEAVLAALQRLPETDEAVLAAFQRYSADTYDLESVQNYLNSLSGSQMGGVTSNVKGILHEMEFVKAENADGDPVTAALFPDTNHVGFDVVLTNVKTGGIREVQLKTTDNQGYVQEWIDKYPDGEILVSQEVADELNLQGSGFSNKELTVRVEDFIDKLTEGGLGSSLWNLFPALPLISVVVVLVGLYRRYQVGEIAEDELGSMVLKATGAKVGKLALLMGAMSISGISVVVGAALIAKVLYALTLIDISKEPSKADYLKPIKQIEGGTSPA